MKGGVLAAMEGWPAPANDEVWTSAGGGHRMGREEGRRCVHVRGAAMEDRGEEWKPRWRAGQPLSRCGRSSAAFRWRDHDGEGWNEGGDRTLYSTNNHKWKVH